MASPSSRATLKSYCLRRLGSPVIKINVEDTQIEDCIDDALQLFQEFHSDATKRIFLKHLITATDVTNKYIDIPSTIPYVIRVLPFDTSSLGNGQGMFSIQYQIRLNDIADLRNFAGGISYYQQMGQYLDMMDMLLNGTPIVTFQRYENRLYIHGEWWDSELKAGDYVIVEAYQIIDETTSTSIYNNMFIKDYTTALIKQRWGQHMSKFEGVQLPGGVTLSGQNIKDEATTELTELRERMRLEYEVMPDFFMG